MYLQTGRGTLQAQPLPFWDPQFPPYVAAALRA